MTENEKTFIWVYEDPARGLALVRGTFGTKDLLSLADLIETARYSVSGKGWVIPLEGVGDLAAAAEMTGATYRTKAVV